MALSKKTPSKQKKSSQSKEKFVLLSVSDKTGVVDFAREISNLGYKIISTGGTYNILKENNIPSISIQEITGNPESFDGRMKTISFQVASGILFDRAKPSHQKQAKTLGILPIDIVVCNLYPFEKTVQNSQATFDDIIENIDVGGPTMIRAAAKNFAYVLVVVDPRDYNMVFSFLYRHSGKPKAHPESKNPGQEFRQSLAAKAFTHFLRLPNCEIPERK